MASHSFTSFSWCVLFFLELVHAHSARTTSEVDEGLVLHFHRESMDRGPRDLGLFQARDGRVLIREEHDLGPVQCFTGFDLFLNECARGTHGGRDVSPATREVGRREPFDELAGFFRCAGVVHFSELGVKHRHPHLRITGQDGLEAVHHHPSRLPVLAAAH